MMIGLVVKIGIMGYGDYLNEMMLIWYFVKRVGWFESKMMGWWFGSMMME